MKYLFFSCLHLGTNEHAPPPVVLSVLSNLDIVFSLLHRDYVVHEGKNLTIKCDDGSKSASDHPVLWSHNGETIQSNYNLIMVILDVHYLSRRRNEAIKGFYCLSFSFFVVSLFSGEQYTDRSRRNEGTRWRIYLLTHDEHFIKY